MLAAFCKFYGMTPAEARAMRYSEFCIFAEVMADATRPREH